MLKEGRIQRKYRITNTELRILKGLKNFIIRNSLFNILHSPIKRGNDGVLDSGIFPPPFRGRLGGGLREDKKENNEYRTQNFVVRKVIDN